MRSRLKDLPGLLRTPVGRREIRGGILYRAWPLTSRLAQLYRRTLARGICIVAVVGSYGKSTTTRCIATALGDMVPQAKRRAVSGGNSRSAVVPFLLQLRPDAPCAVVEAGISGKGQMAPMARTLRPDIAVVTSIGTDHHVSLRTLETTRDEKAEMVRVLAPSGLAVLNGDDHNVMWMAGQTRARVITYGLGETNTIHASGVRLDWPRGMRFVVHAGGTSRELCTRLLGRHMVYPVLAAVAVALAKGCDLEACAARLEQLEPTFGRLHLQTLDNGAALLCDYHKGTHATILAALDLLAEIPARRRIVVLGEVTEPPGDIDSLYRALGERIAHIATRAIFLSQSSQLYAAGAVRGGMPASALTDAGDRVLDAVEALRQDLGPGDVVLIKGRGDQRLDRVDLALAGRRIGCTIPKCNLKRTHCHLCPMLERGWQGIPVVT